MPANFVTDITSNASGIIGDLSPFVTLVVGVLLAVVVISVLINTLKK